MENPWFGAKAYAGSTGILTWQGWLALVLGIGGGVASHIVLHNDWIAALCGVVLIVVIIVKYDPDTPSY